MRNVMKENRIKYPIGLQSFEELRRGGYVYVDKTGFIPSLLDKKYYFLSRPRRFGKSLTLSMLEAYFCGRKDLFEGLSVYDWERDWIEYPVIHIDFNSMKGVEPDEIVEELRQMLFEIAGNYEVSLPFESYWTRERYPIGRLFFDLIRLMSEQYKRNVVVLIDEYDKGIIEVLHDEQLRMNATDLLRPFFSVLKSADRYIKFAFITGVSRFRNTTLFSGANNLSDISLDRRYASFLGITEKEMLTYFQPALNDISERYGWSYDKVVEVLRDRYDGYRFTSEEEYVYNPFSLLSALDFEAFQDYWVATGTSKVLATYLKASKFTFRDLTRRWVSANQLGSTYTKENPLSLFFQTGYLTIRDFDGFNAYRLGIPNQEVQNALVELIIPEFVEGVDADTIGDMTMTLRKAINSGDVDDMMQTLRSLMASIPYHEIDVKLLEKHMHLCMYVVFLMLGVDTKCEIVESAGRVDMVAQTPWRVYVFEFKIDKSAEEALRQIDEKGYAISWEASDRKVIKIGVNFSSKLRTIDSWIAEVRS